MSGAVARFLIEGDIPLPKRKGGRPKDGQKFPFEKLPVSNAVSFFVPGISTAVRAAASEYMRRHPQVRFEIRGTDCDVVHQKHGHRVWRTR